MKKKIILFLIMVFAGFQIASAQSIRISGTVTDESSGQPMPGGGYVTTYTDITDSKIVESDLVEAKAMLEQRVADRTAELEQAMTALQLAKAEAEDATFAQGPGGSLFDHLTVGHP